MWAAAKKHGDGRFLRDISFSYFPLFSFFFHTHCYHPNWMIGRGILPLPWVCASVCRFCLQVGNSLKLEESFIQRLAFFQLSIKQGSRWGKFLQCVSAWMNNKYHSTVTVGLRQNWAVCVVSRNTQNIWLIGLIILFNLLYFIVCFLL